MAEKFAQAEQQLLAAQDPWKVMENYLFVMETIFQIPYVWLSLTDTPQNEMIIHRAREMPFLDERLNVIAPEVLARLTGRGKNPLMLNGDLRALSLSPLSRQK
jgi:hypothetical protein